MVCPSMFSVMFDMSDSSALMSTVHSNDMAAPNKCICKSNSNCIS